MCIRDRYGIAIRKGNTELLEKVNQGLAAIKTDGTYARIYACLLYTSDAADERSSVDLGGRRIIKKKTYTHILRRRRSISQTI